MQQSDHKVAADEPKNTRAGQGTVSISSLEGKVTLVLIPINMIYIIICLLLIQDAAVAGIIASDHNSIPDCVIP